MPKGRPRHRNGSAASRKRTPRPRAVSFEKSFDKDWDRHDAAGRSDMPRLKQAMLLLIANDAPLGPEWLDHPLKGEWSDHRECHIHGNFLLIYEAEPDAINFVRCGTHAELFE